MAAGDTVATGYDKNNAVPTGPTIAEYDAELARYRAALDAGAGPAVVARWIAETQADRKLLDGPAA